MSAAVISRDPERREDGAWNAPRSRFSRCGGPGAGGSRTRAPSRPRQGRARASAAASATPRAAAVAGQEEGSPLRATGDRVARVRREGAGPRRLVEPAGRHVAARGVSARTPCGGRGGKRTRYTRTRTRRTTGVGARGRADSRIANDHAPGSPHREAAFLRPYERAQLATTCVQSKRTPQHDPSSAAAGPARASIGGRRRPATRTPASTRPWILPEGPGARTRSSGHVGLRRRRSRRRATLPTAQRRLDPVPAESRRTRTPPGQEP